MARTALEENQANGISTVINGAVRIFGAGNTANFNAGTHRQAIMAFRQACRQQGCKRNRIPANA
jgi:methylthioribose-1-phosphate isomerase